MSQTKGTKRRKGRKRGQARALCGGWQDLNEKSKVCYRFRELGKHLKAFENLLRARHSILLMFLEKQEST